MLRRALARGCMCRTLARADLCNRQMLRNSSRGRRSCRVSCAGLEIPRLFDDGVSALSSVTAVALQEAALAELDVRLDGLMEVVRLSYLIKREGGWGAVTEWGETLSLGPPFGGTLSGTLVPESDRTDCHDP